MESLWEGALILVCVAFLAAFRLYAHPAEREPWDVPADRVRKRMAPSKSAPMDPALWGRMPRALLEWFLVTYVAPGEQLGAVRLCNTVLRWRCRAIYARRREQQLQFCLRYARLHSNIQHMVASNLSLRVAWLYAEEDGRFMAKVPANPGYSREEVWTVYLQQKIAISHGSNTYDIVGARFDDQKFQRLSVLLRLRHH